MGGLNPGPPERKFAVVVVVSVCSVVCLQLGFNFQELCTNLLGDTPLFFMALFHVLAFLSIGIDSCKLTCFDGMQSIDQT